MQQPQKATVAWVTALSSLAFTVAVNLDRVAKFFGIINIPKDARELMSTLSSTPTLVSGGFLAVGVACVVYLYLEHLAALKRKLWNPRLDLLTFGVIGLIVFAAITGFALYRQPTAVASPPSPLSPPPDPFVRNVAGPPIEWRFDKPATIFVYSRNPGEGVWLDAIQIHGTNKTDKPLKNVRAYIVPDMTDQKMEMRVNPIGTYLPPEESAKLIPPRAAFDLTLAIPPKANSVRPQGLPAEQFLIDYGGLRFSFESSGGSFGWELPLAYLEDQIVFIEEKTRTQATSYTTRKKSDRVPTSAGIELASIGLIPPKNVAVTDEVVVESMAIGFLNISNSEGKDTLFRRSHSYLSSGRQIERRMSFHKFYIAIENKSKTKTLRSARLVLDAIKGPGGSIFNYALLCDRTETGSADIPPGGHDYFVLGDGVDDSDGGMFRPKMVSSDDYDRILARVSELDRLHVGFVLSDAKGKQYTLLKNDGYRIQITAYADDTPPVEALLILNAKSRIELWLTGDMNA